MNQYNRAVNFSAGPAKLPDKVLLTAQKEMMNFDNTGASIMEISHRSADFSRVLTGVTESLRELLNIPENYKILLLQGGGTGQFAAIPMNLMALKDGHQADYVVTGTWSQKAAKEAEKYGKVNKVIPSMEKFVDIPDENSWELNSEASYVYYCANETVHGVEFQFIPETNGVPLVCDMSSNILSKHFDITKFGLVYAGAQKNIGCAGVTLVIVREDLLGHALPYCPSIFDYKVQDGMNSLLNTPPTYSIYIMGLMFNYLDDEGGLREIENRSHKKSQAVYEIINKSKGFYCCPVKHHCRSRMNIPIRIGSQKGIEDLEKKFLADAHKQGLISLKGHRSVGGIRVSLYNAITVEEANKLCDFMRDFQKHHREDNKIVC